MKYSEIYQFRDYREYLHSVYVQKRDFNPAFSIRAWAKQLGFKSPSTIWTVMNGTRPLNHKLAQKIIENVGGGKNELEYLKALALVGESKSEDEKKFYESVLNKLKPNKYEHLVELDRFRLIEDWYHIAIFELIRKFNGSATSEFIFSKLRQTVPLKTIELAIDRLCRVELVARNAKGKLKAACDNFYVGTEIPNTAVERHLSQMLEKAQTALGSQEVSERAFRSSTITLSKKEYTKLKNEINDFIANLHSKYGHEDPERVYQLNIQLFHLSEVLSDQA